MEYDDFIVGIGPDLGEGYAVQVKSPAGEGKGIFRLPFDREALSFFTHGTWLAWQVVFRRGAAVEERPPDLFESLPDLTPEIFGDMLFRALFAGEVESLFRESLGRIAKCPGRGLRIRIEIDPGDPALARLYGLPWELLYRARTEDFLGLSPTTPLVRYLAVPQPPHPLRQAEIRVLVIASSPEKFQALNLEEELRDLRKIWRRSFRVRVTVLAKPDLESLHLALEKGRFHVLHFMGHGEFSPAEGEGVLYLEAENGTPQPVSGRALAVELKNHPSLRLVILNACETGKAVSKSGGNAFAGVASALVLGGIPAVVAMQASIPDSAALTFSRIFYQRLTAGEPVEAAVTEGRRAIYRLNEKAMDWATPLLFLRSPDGRLFASAWKRAGRLAAAIGVVLMAAAASVGLLEKAGQDTTAVDVEGSREIARRLYEEGLQVVEDRGPSDLAEKAFQAALDLDPGLAIARCGLADLQRVRGGGVTQVVDACQQALEQAPGDPVLHYQVGVLYADWDRLEEARLALEEAARLDPGYVAAHNALGDVLLRLGQPKAARDALATGLRSAPDPDPAPLLKNLARVDLRENRLDAAVAHLRQALGQADARSRKEILLLLAQAQELTGSRSEACATLDLLVRGPESIGAGEWERKGRELSGRLSCSAPPAPEIPKRPHFPKPAATRERGSLRATIADFDGHVSVFAGSGGQLGVIRRAYRTLVIPEGQTVQLSDGAWAEIVCSTDTRIFLTGEGEWRLDAAGCLRGESLPTDAYASVAPEAGQVRFRTGQLSVLERRMRGGDEENPLWPVLLHPRETAVLEARPEVVWSGVPEAFEYEIRLMGSGLEPVRLEAAKLQCSPSPDFPASSTVCRAPYPKGFPDLRLGELAQLQIGAVRTIVSPGVGSESRFEVRRLSDAEAADIRRALEKIDASEVGKRARRLLRAGVFARAELWGSAIAVYQELLSEEDIPVLRVTLGNLFLEVGLARQAEAVYEQVLGRQPEIAVQAAAELGIGKAADARGKTAEALNHFRLARDFYSRAGLHEESVLAQGLMTRIEQRKSSR